MITDISLLVGYVVGLFLMFMGAWYHNPYPIIIGLFWVTFVHLAKHYRNQHRQ